MHSRDCTQRRALVCYSKDTTQGRCQRGEQLRVLCRLVLGGVALLRGPCALLAHLGADGVHIILDALADAKLVLVVAAGACLDLVQHLAQGRGANAHAQQVAYAAALNAQGGADIATEARGHTRLRRKARAVCERKSWPLER